MTGVLLIDPELRSLLDAWPTGELTPELLAIIRSGGLGLPTPPVVGNNVAMSRHYVPGTGSAPDVELLIYSPSGNGPYPCIYHIHGGGFVMGDAAALEYAHRPMAETLNCVIVSVNYRLAPETIYPGAINDCYAGLAWIWANSSILQIDCERTGLLGESAGGGLAAALALMVRDRGEYALAFQHLTYPMLDDRTCIQTRPPHAGEFIWTPHNNHFGWQALLGHAPGAGEIPPYAAAARAEDLVGLPPTYISVGALDLFLEEDMEYARRLIQAGVPTELHIYPGAFHGFDIHPTAAVAKQARRDRMDALKRALTPE